MLNDDANLAGLKISLIYHIPISGIIYYSHLFYKYKMYLTPDTIAAKLIKAYKTLLLLPYKARKKIELNQKEASKMKQPFLIVMYRW